MVKIAAAIFLGMLWLLNLDSCARADGAFADTKELPAKGERQCRVAQLTSPFLEAEHLAANAKAGIAFYMQTSSYVKFRVLLSGALLVAMSEQTYPGSKFYFMIDGKRYSGPSASYLQLDPHAVAALKSEKPFDFTYTDWPDRTEISRKDVFAGFSKALDECLVFLGGKSRGSRANVVPLSLSPK